MLEDGIGDTIRVSLTEDPEFEIPVCSNIVKRYSPLQTPSDRVIRAGSAPRGGIASAQSRLSDDENSSKNTKSNSAIKKTNIEIVESSNSLPIGEGFRERLPFEYKRRETLEINNIGAKHVPVVIADLHKIKKIIPEDLEAIGYTYDVVTDKWNINDVAADYIFTADKILDFNLPGTLRVICFYDTWLTVTDKEKYFPILDDAQFMNDEVQKSSAINFVMVDCFSEGHPIDLEKLFTKLKEDKTAVICLSSTNKNAVQSIRRMFIELIEREIKNPVVLIVDSNHEEMDESLIHYAVEAGALLLDGFGDGICLGHRYAEKNVSVNYKLLNSIAFGILQATRTRISKTEYISCPSCGRTLFDLQETTAKIRAVTNHLKGVKIAIMGCIVNGPGEMADADFGYVGSGPGKITLYKGKEVVKRSVSEEVAVSELVNLIKENEAWVEP